MSTNYGLNRMDVWLFRQNHRRKMIFGVHEAASKAFSIHGGESWLRFQSIEMCKSTVLDNIECIRLMRSSKFKEHLNKMNIKAKEFYLSRRL